MPLSHLLLRSQVRTVSSLGHLPAGVKPTLTLLLIPPCLLLCIMVLLKNSPLLPIYYLVDIPIFRLPNFTCPLPFAFICTPLELPSEVYTD